MSTPRWQNLVVLNGTVRGPPYLCTISVKACPLAYFKGNPHRWSEEVLVGSRRSCPLKVIDGGQEHIRIVQSDHALHDIELPAATVAAHPSAVAPVLRCTDNLRDTTGV